MTRDEYNALRAELLETELTNTQLALTELYESILEGKAMKIFINPGHCIDSDSGAVGFGLTEAEVAMQIAKRVSHYLAAVGYKTKVFQYDGLEEIVDVSNYWDADLFVSIHCNAFNGAARGTETFYFHNSVEGENLALLTFGDCHKI